MISKVMKEYAAIESPSQEQIEQTCVDLYHVKLKLEDRLKKALDKEAVALDEKIKELTAEVSAKQEYILNQAETHAVMFKQLKAEVEALDKNLETTLEQRQHLVAEVEDYKLMGVNILGRLLLRWKPFLETYGEAAYSETKLAFVGFGGDAKMLPMPESSKTPQSSEQV